MHGPSKGNVATIKALCAHSTAGAVAFEVDPARDKTIADAYAGSIAKLDMYAFWRAAEKGTYRPDKGLWLPQRRAVAFTHAYLAAWDAGAADANFGFAALHWGRFAERRPALRLRRMVAHYRSKRPSDDKDLRTRHPRTFRD
ncbi:hypothetical protein [Sinorhizobium meliloti]|uniref:hypothetical protein n=1 Tax=Rhizobium meliloti TaxID=382 RepID=UPI000FDAB386|nr:hypothetical protein [Sinorhizobium meliloti]RVG86212.1 hypothetical protein CN218_30495 [Sinorhizobium meliloti]